MQVMSTRKPNTRKPQDDQEKDSWDVFARIDKSLRSRTEAYIASREYPPPMARVIEKALRLLLEKEGF